jgi:putative addiction module killer protein
MKLSVVHYVTRAGKDLYQAWLEHLKDKTARAAITRRVIRIELGELGDHKRIGDGVSELRIDVGPGYRVYYGTVEKTIVVLLIAGTKGTQERDIDRAKTYWQDFQERYGSND